MNQATIRPYRTLNGIQNLSRVLNDGFALPSSKDSNQWVPQVDIRENEKGFSVQVDIPGVDPKDVDITVEKGVMEIKGSRLTDTESKQQGYQRVERFSGNFNRKFTLPETADGESITARADQGVLTIDIPKTEKSKPRVIAIDS